MRYYQVDITANPTVTGVKNGIYQIEIDKKAMLKNIAFAQFLDFFNSKNSSLWQKQSQIKNFNIPSIKGKMIKNAVPTDVMGYTENIPYFNYIFSKKYIDILQAFKIDNYSTFAVEIEDLPEKYYLLFFETITLEEINYKKSKLFTGNKRMNNVLYHPIANYEEYREVQKENPLLAFEKVSIPKKYFGKDVIKAQASSLAFYSDRLIDFLLDCKVTNLDPRYDSSLELDFY